MVVPLTSRFKSSKSSNVVAFSNRSIYSDIWAASYFLVRYHPMMSSINLARRQMRDGGFGPCADGDGVYRDGLAGLDHFDVPVRGEAIEQVTYEGGQSTIAVDVPRIYHLVRNRSVERHQLELAWLTRGLEGFAFTFTSCSWALTPRARASRIRRTCAGKPPPPDSCRASGRGRNRGLKAPSGARPPREP